MKKLILNKPLKRCLLNREPVSKDKYVNLYLNYQAFLHGVKSINFLPKTRIAFIRKIAAEVWTSLPTLP